MGDSPFIKHTVPAGPYLNQPLPTLTTAITHTPPDGMMHGKDIQNVWVDLTWTDGHQEKCKALVRAWTSESVHVWADSSRGRYVVWVSPQQITRRQP